MNKLRVTESPDYSSLPIVTFNLAGHQAVLPIPDNSGSVATDLAKTDINLDEIYGESSDPLASERCFSLIYNLSWDIYKAQTSSLMGRLRLGVSIMDNRANTFSFLDDHSLKTWMLTRNKENYGGLNEEIRKERELNGLACTQEHLFTYAKEPDDIFVHIVDGRKWFAEKSGAQGGSEAALSFRTALDSRFAFNLEFDWSAPPETYDAFKAEVDDLQLEYLHKVRLIPA